MSKSGDSDLIYGSVLVDIEALDAGVVCVAAHDSRTVVATYPGDEGVAIMVSRSSASSRAASWAVDSSSGRGSTAVPRFFDSSDLLPSATMRCLSPGRRIVPHVHARNTNRRGCRHTPEPKAVPLDSIEYNYLLERIGQGDLDFSVFPGAKPPLKLISPWTFVFAYVN